jgi:DsbE subfamily thiol:disulfide oxidoreductase
MRIQSTTNLRIVGVNYKDDPEQALRWLADYGNPYEFTLRDTDGSLGVELGVYGAPESFLLDASGIIVYKHVGDINARVWRDEILPIIERFGIDLSG